MSAFLENFAGSNFCHFRILRSCAVVLAALVRQKMESVSSTSIISGVSVATLATLADENNNEVCDKPKKSVGKKIAKGKSVPKKGQ